MVEAENRIRVVRLKNGGQREFRSKEERRRIVEEFGISRTLAMNLLRG